MKFILFSNDLAYGVVNVVGPPYSASCVLSIDFTIPLAMARTMTVLIGHPCSLSFIMYCCTASSSFFPRSNGLPRFFSGSSSTVKPS